MRLAFVLTLECVDCLTKTQASVQISEQTVCDSQSIKDLEEAESR